MCVWGGGGWGVEVEVAVKEGRTYLDVKYPSVRKLPRGCPEINQCDDTTMAPCIFRYKGSQGSNGSCCSLVGLLLVPPVVCAAALAATGAGEKLIIATIF